MKNGATVTQGGGMNDEHYRQLVDRKGQQVWTSEDEARLSRKVARLKKR